MVRQGLARIRQGLGASEGDGVGVGLAAGDRKISEDSATQWPASGPSIR
jgi:hypothetical protein